MYRSSQQAVILVGVGGSGASQAALAWAAREARRREAMLRVVQAWEPHPARALYAGSADLGLHSRTAATDQLAQQVRSVLGGGADSGAADLDLVFEVIEGPAERVLATASASAELLVLGSGGQSLVAQLDPVVVDRPVGPVIRACMSHARCPVVIINPVMAAEQDLDPAGWAGQAAAGSG